VQDELLADPRPLAEFGPSLGRPAVDTLTGGRIANKEPRFSALGGVWRVAFAFDRRRIAVLMAICDKRGKNKSRSTGLDRGFRGALGGDGSVKDMQDRMPADRGWRVEARAEELIAQEMSLRELRKAR
jgi:hypothetical protein